MNKLQSINSHITQLFNQSRKLNDNDFEKFLYNLELTKKYIITKRRDSKKPKLHESFRTILEKSKV